MAGRAERLPVAGTLITLIAVLMVTMRSTPGNPLTAARAGGRGLAFALPTLPLCPLAYLFDRFSRTCHSQAFLVHCTLVRRERRPQVKPPCPLRSRLAVNEASGGSSK